MSSFIMTIFTTRHIGKKEFAYRFFDVLEKYSLLPDKIGLFEPIRKDYSLEEAIKMWTSQIGTMPHYRGGNLTGKKKEPNVRFDIDWGFGESARANYLNVWFTRKSFKQCRDNIENLFRDLIITVDSFHGYISDFDLSNAQHVTGTIEKRMDGIFWCNYYGREFVDFFGKETILSAPWYHTEVVGENGIITFLTKEPDDQELVDSTALIDRIKRHLGKDSFGDVEKWLAGDTRITQIKDMPKFDFSEIRRPVSEFKLP